MPRSRTITPRTARRGRILLLILISAGFAALAGAKLLVFTTGLRNRIFLAIIMVASFLIADAYFRWGVESMRAFLRGLTLFELLIVYVVVAFLVGRANGTIQFYEVSAQLIPLLVLALIYQSNAFAVAKIKRNRAVILWAIASALAMLASGGLGVFLLRAVGLTGVPAWVDVLVIGLAVGSGTKPLHDLISNLQSSSSSQEASAASTKTA